MADEDSFPCPLCPKRYKRREHMQRHYTTHNPSRPYTCAQCARAFQRPDVLKRHSRTCEAKARGWISPAGRRRACDLCARQKKACSTEQPCLNCRRAGAMCKYSFQMGGNRRDDASQGSGVSGGSGSEEGEGQAVISVGEATIAVEEETVPVVPMNDFNVAMFGDPMGFNLLDPGSDANASWLDFLNLMQMQAPPPGYPPSDGSPPQGQPPTPRPRKYTFSFLENFTRRTGLLESFECGTPALRDQIAAHFLRQAENESLTLRIPAETLPLPCLPDLSPLPETFAPPLPGSSFPSLHGHWLHDSLMIKVHQIIVLAREVVTTKPRNSAVTVDWSLPLEQKCLEFFSPGNVRRYLALYWAVWHPNVNIVHRPTFDAASASPTLLAAMAVMGACMSPDLADRGNAKLWFNCVEEMVFTDDDLCSEPLYTLDTGVWIPATQKPKVQALQAAYIVCLFQNWEGTDASKRRIRRYRFGTIVSAARDIGLSAATHPCSRRSPGYEFDWKTFAIKEELIRIFLWIFLLDHAFVTFNNLPPRMVIKEMKIHMARPEACFQAVTAEECLEELQAWSAHSPVLSTLTFHEAVEMVCRGGMSEDMHRTLANLGPLNLFGVISAVHSLVFQHQNAIGEYGNLLAIRHALQNWKPIWEHYCAKISSHPPHNMVPGDIVTPENAWRRNGFSRYAHEYWLLASVITDRLSAPEAGQGENGLGLRGGRGGSPGEGGGGDPILTRYDQTSMRQVNDLIADFQKFQIFSNTD